LSLGSALLDGLGDAVPEMIFQQAECDRLQRPGHRGDLGEDLDAVDVLFHHALEAADLALDPPQALEVGVLVLGISAHDLRLHGHEFSERAERGRPGFLPAAASSPEFPQTCS